MKKLLFDNAYFFLGCISFFIVGGILLTQIETSDEIFFFSKNRSTGLNTFFYYFTKMGEEIVYALLLILFLFKKVRYALMIPLIGVLVTIISYFTKDYFAHDRPKVFLEKNGWIDQVEFVEGVEVLYGQTSFPSGHTMSAFALYGIVAFIISRKGGWGFLLALIAILIGVSRIYLVQHFLKDIYLGAVCGVIIAMIIYLLQSKVKRKNSHWLNQPLFDLENKKAVAGKNI